MKPCRHCGRLGDFYTDAQRQRRFRHLDGRWCQAKGSSYATEDYSEPRVSKESECYLTKCPDCNASVFFIRHNGGSLWVDPPLGPPWWKHDCMNNGRPSAVRRESIQESLPPSVRGADGLILGVVRSSAVHRREDVTVLTISTGELEPTVIRVARRGGGFLVGKLVVLDPIQRTVSQFDSDLYVFKIVD